MFKKFLLSLLISSIASGATYPNLKLGDSAPILGSAIFEAKSTTKGVLIPRMTTSQKNAIVSPDNGLLVYDTDLSKTYQFNGTGWATLGSGAGQGGINYILNPDAEVDGSGWSTYADAAGTSPVDGTGGSPASTFTRTTSSPLRGAASFLITKSANNRQGEGVSYDFSIDRADRNKVLSVTFDHEIASGTFATGDSSDIQVFIYDVTNSQLITPGGLRAQSIQSTPGKYQATWASTTSTSYRLIFHIATTSASAYTLKVDNVQVGPQELTFGPAATDWKSDSTFTPSASFGTIGTSQIFSRREGDSIWVKGYFQPGTTTSSNAYISLPANLAIDYSKLGTDSLKTHVGLFGGIYPTSPQVQINDANSGIMVVDGSDTGKVYLSLFYLNGSYEISHADTISSGSSQWIDFSFKIPIQGWSVSVATANSSVFRIADALANGTRVTTTPAVFGEYRTRTRTVNTASTYNDNAPGASPSAANGMRIYNRKYDAAETTANTEMWDIFVGKNKNVKPQYYASSGRTGLISTDVQVYGGSNDTATGLAFQYDPTTGVATIFAPIQSTATGAGFVGQTTPGTYVNDCYFDLIISENALQVQIDSAVVASYHKSSSTSVTVDTQINFDTKEIDTHGAVTTGASWKFTAPKAGYYEVNSAVETLSQHHIGLWKNGTKIIYSFVQENTNNSGTGSYILYLLAGDYIDLRPDTTMTFSGGALTTAGTSFVTVKSVR